jgi:hypothetical protein
MATYIHLYIHKRKFYIPTMATSEGPDIAVPPVMIGELDAPSLTIAIRDALSQESPHLALQPNRMFWREYRDPTHIAAGVKSWRAFALKSQFFTVKRQQEDFLLDFYRVDNRGGYAWQDSATLQFSGAIAIEQIAQQIVTNVHQNTSNGA